MFARENKIQACEPEIFPNETDVSDLQAPAVDVATIAFVPRALRV
jgi:hypothetical protein